MEADAKTRAKDKWASDPEYHWFSSFDQDDTRKCSTPLNIDVFISQLDIDAIVNEQRLNGIFCRKILVKMQESHWASRWKRAILKLAKVIEMRFIAEEEARTRHPTAVRGKPGGFFRFHFPLLNGKYFPLELVCGNDDGTCSESLTSQNAEYLNAIVYLKDRLLITEMRAVPWNIWFSFLLFIYDHHSSRQIPNQLVTAFERHLATHSQGNRCGNSNSTISNWIRVPYENYHPDVLLIVGGKLVQRSEKKSRAWTEHLMAPETNVDDLFWHSNEVRTDKNTRESVPVVWDGKFKNRHFTHQRAKDLFLVQVVRFFKLCFRHDARKYVAAKEATEAMLREDDFNFSTFEIYHYKRNNNNDKTCDEKDVFHTSNNICDAILSPKDVADISNILQDFPYHLRFFAEIGGWFLAAVKVARRIDEYQLYLRQLFSCFDISNQSNSSNRLIKEVTDIVGQYFILSEVPKSLFLNHPAVTVEEWKHTESRG